MKLAYVTIEDGRDPHAWSGLSLFIARALERQGFELNYIGNLKRRRSVATRIKELFYRRVAGKDFHREREPWVAKAYARQVEAALRGVDVDAIFSPGTLPIARVAGTLPVAFWTDATFAGLLDFYPGFGNLCWETLRDGNRLEKEALRRSHLAIYSSEWAAETAIRHYGTDSRRIHVVPFGANLDLEPGRSEIAAAVERRRRDECQLLFVGVHWHRKGGDVAVEVARRLNRRGVPARLHVVGCDPPNPADAFVEPHGHISKRTSGGRAQIDALYDAAHFLILPTRADCVPVVFAEASARGVPCLTTDVGGIRSAVRAGRNGRIFAVSDDPDTWCDAIATLWSDRDAYVRLALSSHDEYRARLNWDVAGQRVGDLLRCLAAGARHPG